MKQRKRKSEERKTKKTIQSQKEEKTKTIKMMIDQQK